MSRSGSTSSVNRKMTLENSPTVRSLDWIRDAPITTSVMLASDGITSSSASNQLRSRIACTRDGADLLGEAGEPLGLALLGAVGLDQLHALEALVDAGGELTELILGACEVRPTRPARRRRW